VRTIVSHGVAEQPPNRVDLDAGTLETTLPVRNGARTVRLTAETSPLPIEAVGGQVTGEHLSPFYGACVDDELAWCAKGAGRMPRAPVVFEDVAKTN
jgi:hypothetical protein